MGMLKFKIVTEITDIEKLSNKVLGHKRIPPYLLIEEKYTKLVIGMEEGNNLVGLAYGVIEHRSNVLFLHFLFVKKEFRSYSSVRSLIESAFKIAMDARGVKSAVWKYTLAHDKADSRLKLLRDIPFCHCRKISRSQQIKIKTTDISFIREFKIFNPQLLKSRGYDVLAWSDCDEGLLGKIREIEQSFISDPSYVSPFNENDDGGQEFDRCNSYILVNAEANKPMGWIVCSVISEKEVMIRNFYMYPNSRSFMIAHSFASYILDIIAQRYKYLSFNVVDGNRQMEMIVRKYFKPILESSNIQCSMFVDFLTEGGGDI